jgi:hypothetical protein
MALEGPFAVIADSSAPDVVEALRKAGAYPVVETGWCDAPAALTSIEPEGVVAEPCPDRSRADSVAAALDAHHSKAAVSTCRFSPAAATTALASSPTR